VAALILVFLSTGTVLSRGRTTNEENARVLARLDEFTRSRGQSANTIPPFLLLPGDLGMEVGPSVIEPLSATELQKGFCTPSVAQLVRYRYPEDYQALADAELERLVVEKHPEYREQVCYLPPWIGAAPHQIVKYEKTAQSGFFPAVLAWLGAALVTVAVGAIGLNLYYRMMIRRFAAAH
jgi:hypothetical protein